MKTESEKLDKVAPLTSTDMVCAGSVPGTKSEKLLQMKVGKGAVVSTMDPGRLDIEASASPILKPTKRSLVISPSTPVGLVRKYTFDGGEKEMKVLTFGEDVDMVDLEVKDPRPEPDIKRMSGRKVTKGLRRKHLGLDLGVGLFSQSGGSVDNRGGVNAESDTGNNTSVQEQSHIKGTCGIRLKIKPKCRKLIRSKPVKNYKSTKKKFHNSIDTGTTQSSIHDYFNKIPNNNVILGQDGGASGVGGSIMGLGGDLED